MELHLILQEQGFWLVSVSCLTPLLLMLMGSFQQLCSAPWEAHCKEQAYLPACSPTGQQKWPAAFLPLFDVGACEMSFRFLLLPFPHAPDP